MKDFTLPAPINLVNSMDDLGRHGDIHYVHHRFFPNVVVGLIRFCPGCEEPKYIAFHPFADAQEREWNWNGDRKKPSLLQPINCSCGYRAQLVHGDFV